MTIESIDNGNLRVWLAEHEIEEWGLDDSQPGGIRRLVRRALATVGRRPTKRVQVEMIPVAGGCVVLITTEKRATQPVVYAISEKWLKPMTARWRYPITGTAQVYALESGYGVILHDYGEAGDALLREYGHPVGCGAALAAHVAEYGEWVLTMPAPEPPENEDRAR